MAASLPAVERRPERGPTRARATGPPRAGSPPGAVAKRAPGLRGIATSRASGTLLVMTRGRASLNASRPLSLSLRGAKRRSNPITIGHRLGEGCSQPTVLRRDGGTAGCSRPAGPPSAPRRRGLSRGDGRDAPKGPFHPRPWNNLRFHDDFRESLAQSWGNSSFTSKADPHSSGRAPIGRLRTARSRTITARNLRPVPPALPGSSLGAGAARSARRRRLDTLPAEGRRE